MISKTTARIIYRCKAHKTVIRQSFDQIVDRQDIRPYRVLSVKFIEQGTSNVLSTSYLPHVECPTCAEIASKMAHPYVFSMRGEAVRGRVVESIKCGGKCLNAIGPSCDCSCGGENHGAGFEAIKQYVA